MRTIVQTNKLTLGEVTQSLTRSEKELALLFEQRTYMKASRSSAVSVFDDDSVLAKSRVVTSVPDSHNHRHHHLPPGEPSMKMYLMSIYQPDGAVKPPPDRLAEIMREINVMNKELHERGAACRGQLGARARCTSPIPPPSFA
jgi:hypothetical protein